MKNKDPDEEAALEAADQAVIEQLKRTMSVTSDRQIKTLGKQEVRHISIGCISAWVKERARISAGQCNGVADSISEYLLT